MSRLLQFLIVLAACVIGCREQTGPLSDQQVLAAAEKAFSNAGWNPKIFEAKPITRRSLTLDDVLDDSLHQDVKKELLKDFGNGPFTIVTYKRRPTTLVTNGGESYCQINFLVYSAKKVAEIDSRASSRSEDKSSAKP